MAHDMKYCYSKELLLTDVEITGLSEANGENPVHLVCLVSKKLGVELEERDIVSAVRVGPKRGMTEGAAPVKPRPLAVRLSRRAQRDNMLRAARVRHGANTEGLELPGPPVRFQVNERLTKTNRQLFYDTRQADTNARHGKTYTNSNSSSSVYINSTLVIYYYIILMRKCTSEHWLNLAVYFDTGERKAIHFEIAGRMWTKCGKTGDLSIRKNIRLRQEKLVEARGNEDGFRDEFQCRSDSNAAEQNTEYGDEGGQQNQKR
ncbi:unnamed protein product [Leptidea sinapis]|uniref:Uncharacterized protein n=1 Tax=Leptidea sinapis TaxID=189913 RepID=A0A5E4Q1Z1_9NEOP|nr:unnamed protein product [Leptidea sinapis]